MATRTVSKKQNRSPRSGGGRVEATQPAEAGVGRLLVLATLGTVVLAMWPSINDVILKDANDVLMSQGARVLRECIEAAEAFPIKSLFSLAAYEAEIWTLYDGGRARGASVGWKTLDPHYTVRPGDLTVVTGYASSGKSEFVDAIMVNLAMAHDWRFAVCSFENPVAEHFAKLAQKHLGQPFHDGPSPRMGRDDAAKAMMWVDYHFVFIRTEDESPTIDWILDTARSAVRGRPRRRGGDT